MNETPNTYNLKEEIKPIHLTTILLILCQIIRLIFSYLLSPTLVKTSSSVADSYIVIILTVIISIALYYCMYVGKKWPVYLSALGAIMSIFMLLDHSSDLNGNLVSNMDIIFAWTMFMIETSLICYLLFYPPCKVFYIHNKLAKLQEKENMHNQ